VNFKKEQVREYNRHQEKFYLKGYNDNGNDDDDRGNESGEF
jgi:hypothetical protein